MIWYDIIWYYTILYYIKWSYWIIIPYIIISYCIILYYWILIYHNIISYSYIILNHIILHYIIYTYIYIYVCVSCSPENCSFKILVKFNHVLLGKSRGPFGMSCIITYWSIQWGPPLYQSINQWEKESVWLSCWDMFRRNILCPHLQLRKIHVPKHSWRCSKDNSPLTDHSPSWFTHNFLIKFGLLMVKSSVCVVKLHVQHD